MMKRLQRVGWWIVFGLGLLGFAVLALLLTQPATIMLQFDAAWADACYEYTSTHPIVKDAFTIITDTGAGRPLYIIGIICIVVLVIRREWYVALLWAIGQYPVKYLPDLIKAQFERPRPPHAEMGGFSFPSGHALGSAAIYGMLAYLMFRWCRGTRFRWLFMGLLYLHIALIGLSRMLLSAHYFSDVVAGTCAGLAWAAFWAALAEMRKPATVTTTTSPPGV